MTSPAATADSPTAALLPLERGTRMVAGKPYHWHRVPFADRPGTRLSLRAGESCDECAPPDGT